MSAITSIDTFVSSDNFVSYTNVRIVSRYDNFTGNTCYSLVMAKYVISTSEARRAAIDAEYAESFNMTVINYGTDCEDCKEAYNFWVCSK